MLLWDVISRLVLVFELVCELKYLLLLLYKTWFVITMTLTVCNLSVNYLLQLLYKTWFVITMTPMCCNLSTNCWWNIVTCDVLCWITAILVVCKLVWNPLWFQLTTEFIWAQVQEFDHFSDHFCTCALINWTVLLQLVSELDSTLNMSYGYLKTKAFVAKMVFQLIVIYRCFKIWKKI